MQTSTGIPLKAEDLESADPFKQNEILGTSSMTTKLSVPPMELESNRSKETDNTLKPLTLANDVVNEMGESKTLSHDSFSFMMFSPFKSHSYAIATVVFIIQMTIFILIMNELSTKDAHKNLLGVPPNVSVSVHICQLIAIIIATFTQEDMRTAFILIHDGPKEIQLEYHPSTGNVTYIKYVISVSCRFLMGFTGLVATFMLIITESEVLELFLNFTAIEFVSQLDDLAYLLAANGYLGGYAKKTSKDVVKTEYFHVNRHRKKNGESSKKMSSIMKSSLLFFVMAFMVIFWGVIVHNQKQGRFLCDTIHVQLGDEFIPALGAFSGVYQRNGFIYEEKRSNYLREETGLTETVGMATFSYCSKHNFWAFNIHDPSKINSGGWKIDPCEWKARSEETKSYDLASTSSSEWLVKKDTTGSGILQQISLSCIDCKYNDDVCGSEGVCNADENKCVCNDGWYGIQCDFLTPCSSLETDTLYGHFVGLREYSSSFTLLRDDNSQMVEIYGHPVYANKFEEAGFFGYDVIYFAGRRWVLVNAYPKMWRSYPNATIAKYISSWVHAHWSEEYYIAFISEPSDINTPKDAVTPIGLDWYEAKSELEQKNKKFHKLAPAKTFTDVNVKLLCSSCNNETNPCFYDGVCQKNSYDNVTTENVCKCSPGSKGTLCQTPPVSDGKCDMYFNTPQFSYDGGDCCKVTCTSNSQYTCGEGVLDHTATGTPIYGYVGYPNCTDPKYKLVLSNSYTLYQIVNRGFLRCGVSQLIGFFEITNSGEQIGFEADLCRAIASATLKNPEAVEFVLASDGKWLSDLQSGAYDVLIDRFSITAERDILNNDIGTGVEFTTPYLIDGLRLGGIPPFGACAFSFDWTSPKCTKLKICVYKGTTWHDIIRARFPSHVIVPVGGASYGEYLEGGFCNSVAGESISLDINKLQGEGFTGAYFQVDNKTLSHENLAGVTKQDDRVWSKFVSWVFEALIQAEQFNITKETPSDEGLALNDVFGGKFINMFQNAVAANGNYGEIYEKNLEVYIPRGSGMNNINTGSTGIFHSYPFGNVNIKGPNPEGGSMIATILNRGTLKCGVRYGASGFSAQNIETGTWDGLEVDICKGISAAIFNGAENVQYFPTIPSERFSMLDKGTVDILLGGVSHTLKREINEPTTGKMFDFSPTYFYDGLQFAGLRPYGICADRLIFDNETFSPECPDTKICVSESSTSLDSMIWLNVPKRNIIAVPSFNASYESLVLGKCNVIAGESTLIAEMILRKNNDSFSQGDWVESMLTNDNKNQYYFGENKYSTERLAVVSRSDDIQFSELIRWLVMALFYSAEEGISRETYHDMPGDVYLFGEDLPNMFKNMIKSTGNIDELFDRNFNYRAPRNQINRDNTPQLYAKVGMRKRLRTIGQV